MCSVNYYMNNLFSLLFLRHSCSISRKQAKLGIRNAWFSSCITLGGKTHKTSTSFYFIICKTKDDNASRSKRLVSPYYVLGAVLNTFI